MVFLLVGLMAALPEPPTWRLVVRHDATKIVLDLATPHGKRAEFAAGPWRCELVTYTEEPDPAGGRFTLTRFDGFLSCKRPVGSAEAVILASAASCANVDIAPGVSDEVREFATTLVQRSYGRLRVTLGSTSVSRLTDDPVYTVYGGCFRAGLPSPPTGPVPPFAPAATP